MQGESSKEEDAEQTNEEFEREVEQLNEGPKEQVEEEEEGEGNIEEEQTMLTIANALEQTSLVQVKLLP